MAATPNVSVDLKDVPLATGALDVGARTGGLDGSQALDGQIATLADEALQDGVALRFRKGTYRLGDILDLSVYARAGGTVVTEPGAVFTEHKVEIKGTEANPIRDFAWHGVVQFDRQGGVTRGINAHYLHNSILPEMVARGYGSGSAYSIRYLTNVKVGGLVGENLHSASTGSQGTGVNSGGNFDNVHIGYVIVRGTDPTLVAEGLDFTQVRDTTIGVIMADGGDEGVDIGASGRVQIGQVLVRNVQRFGLEVKVEPTATLEGDVAGVLIGSMISHEHGLAGEGSAALRVYGGTTGATTDERNEAVQVGHLFIRSTAPNAVGVNIIGSSGLPPVRGVRLPNVDIEVPSHAVLVDESEDFYVAGRMKGAGLGVQVKNSARPVVNVTVEQTGTGASTDAGAVKLVTCEDVDVRARILSASGSAMVTLDCFTGRIEAHVETAERHGVLEKYQTVNGGPGGRNESALTVRATVKASSTANPGSYHDYIIDNVTGAVLTGVVRSGLHLLGTNDLRVNGAMRNGSIQNNYIPRGRVVLTGASHYSFPISPNHTESEVLGQVEADFSLAANRAGGGGAEVDIPWALGANNGDGTELFNDGSGAKDGFKAPVAGYYLVEGQIDLPLGAAGDELRISTSLVANAASTVLEAAATTIAVSGVVYLDAGHQARLYGFWGSGANKTIVASAATFMRVRGPIAV